MKLFMWTLLRHDAQILLLSKEIYIQIIFTGWCECAAIISATRAMKIKTRYAVYETLSFMLDMKYINMTLKILTRIYDFVSRMCTIYQYNNYL